MITLSCICITYSRVALLEEAIECFLKQTYHGPKELIILNDCADQTLKYEHPEIVIFNTNKRFQTVGEKRDAAIALSKYDYLVPWDDDDIHLPHRLEFCANKIANGNLDYYKLNQAFVCYTDHNITNHCINQFYGCSVFSRKFFKETKGHGALNGGEDTFLENQFTNIAMKRLNSYLIENTKKPSITLYDLYYIYRWGGIPTHLSEVYLKPDPLAIIEAQRKQERNRPTGVVTLKPHWNRDYMELVNKYIQEKTNATLPVSR